MGAPARRAIRVWLRWFVLFAWKLARPAILGLPKTSFLGIYTFSADSLSILSLVAAAQICRGLHERCIQNPHGLPSEGPRTISSSTDCGTKWLWQEANARPDTRLMIRGTTRCLMIVVARLVFYLRRFARQCQTTLCNNRHCLHEAHAELHLRQPIVIRFLFVKGFGL